MYLRNASCYVRAESGGFGARVGGVCTRYVFGGVDSPQRCFRTGTMREETAQRARLYAESGKQGGKFPAQVGKRWEMVGTDFRFCSGNGKGWENGEKIPTKSGKGKCGFVGEMEGWWEFPAFSRGRFIFSREGRKEGDGIG
jgi:hypothetical protein